MVSFKTGNGYSRVRFPLILAVILTITGIQVHAQTSVEDLLKGEGFSLAVPRPKAPDFSLELTDGTVTTLSDYEGKVVFLNFWATWCRPCRIEMPTMENLYNAMPQDKFEILAVSLREDKETVVEFAEDLDLSFPILLDSTGTTGSIYGVQGIPTTYIVDKKGYLIARLVGSRDWDTEGFINVLKAVMEE